MASNPAITEQGLANVFRLTNRDDHKGPALARWLTTKMGKKAAVVVDDGTPYGKGIADQFSSGFAAVGGAVVKRWTAKADQTDFTAEVAELPKDFDVLFFGGIKEGAYVLKDMRKAGSQPSLRLWRRLLERRRLHQAGGGRSDRGGRASASSRPRPHSARFRARLNSLSATRPASGRSTITPQAPMTARAS